MDNFRTVLNNSPSSFSIGLRDGCFTMGSCFADNLGLLLQKHKFEVLVNPFGTTYNPISIHKALNYAIQNELPSTDTFGELNETYFNFDFHSSFSALDINNLQRNIGNAISKSHSSIESATTLLITYGTSWVYERKDNGEIVSNCHKVPSAQFNKQLLTQKKILESFKIFYQQLMVVNPNIRIILTLSPVRHIKDSLELNAVSKSILRLSCHTLSELYPQVEYFPAYEIVLDDLRDYRFYDRDLLHPSGEAIDYIWRIFGERYFTKDTADFIKQWDEIIKALTHRPYHPTSAMHQKFLSHLLSKLEGLKQTINVDKEISQVKSQLKY
ncbi:MAG: GSCFA domain-containing protein [Cyclobacteriaceae bacterium]